MTGPRHEIAEKTSTNSTSPSLLRDYAAVAAMLALAAALLVNATRGPSVPLSDTKVLLGPVFAMVLLTAVVWLAMAIVRNASVMRGLVSVRYYQAYTGDTPPDWIERPARTFNNLMQVPLLFYVLCLFLMVTHAADEAQVTVAWIFFGARLVHAAIYILVNRVSLRFAAYVASCIALAVMWTRFAMQI